MNRRTGRVEFAAERITSTVLSVIGLGVGVSRSADILEILFRQGRFVGRKRSSRSCAAGAKEKDGDESRENGQGEATKFSVGQGGSPAKLLTLIHNRARRFFHDKIRGNHFNEPSGERKWIPSSSNMRNGSLRSFFQQRSCLFASYAPRMRARSGGMRPQPCSSHRCRHSTRFSRIFNTKLFRHRSRSSSELTLLCSARA